MKQDEKRAIIDAHAKITYQYIIDGSKLALAHGLDPFPFLYELTKEWLKLMEPYRSSDDPDRMLNFLKSVFVVKPQPDE